MEPEPPEYEPSGRAAERAQRQAARRGIALAVAYIVVVVIVVAAAFGCPDDGRAPIATTTGGEDGTTTSTTGTGTGPLTFTAELTGDQQDPPVDTSGSGTLTFTVADDGSKIDFVLRVTNLDDPTVARLREGKAGETGEVIITLYDNPKSGTFTGVLTQGTFRASDLEGPLEGKTIEDLVTLMLTESVYLNLGTSNHKGGELRGQLEES